MNKGIINIIYEETLEFCNLKGLLRGLHESLTVSENKRFSDLHIDQEGLGVLDAVHCLVDKKRTIILLEEIYKDVKSGNIVVEAGIGTGILSFVASINAERVYAFEINESIFNLANEIKTHLIKKKIIKDNIIFIKGDARSAKLHLKADLIISENLYTGMFFEKQVEITIGLKPFLSTGGFFIPSAMTSSFIMCNSNLKNTQGKNEMYVVSEMENIPKYLSNKCMYDSLDFKNIEKNKVNFETIVDIDKDGFVDSILICSDVSLPSGKVIGRYDTIFMNNDIIISLKDIIEVKKNDRVKVHIIYFYGSNPSDMMLQVNKL